MNNVSIIGGGPAGMVAAILAKRNNKDLDITIYEKNDKLGKKLFITGKGRCNVTNASDVENLITNTMTNPYFMYSGYYSFDSFATMEFFESLGLRLKVERGNRVFPVSDKSSDVISALENEIRKLKIKVKFNTTVDKVLKNENGISAIVVDGTEIPTNKVVICTGGISYQATGSTGDGYRMAKEVGHKVTKLHASLVPLKADENSFDFKALQGLSLKNVKLTAFVDNKKVHADQGEMLFTHFGLSGPLVLTASRYFVGKYNKECRVEIDMKPALDHQTLDKRILRDFQQYINKDFSNALVDLLPQKLIPVVIDIVGVKPDKKVNEITKEERKKLVDTIKGMNIKILSDNGYNMAVITCGGVDVNEVNPSTCESNLVNGLFFAGEVLDVDCLTGGYNLQVTYSTAFLVANNL